MADWNAQIISEFRNDGGNVATMGFGKTLVLVHSTGAKSGQPRVNPLRAIPYDGGWFVAASAGGAPTDPAWAFNLRAHPDVVVEAPDGSVPARARELQGAERDAAWQHFLDAAPAFAEYEANAGRRIPVFALDKA